ncbi:MAG: N-acetylmuramoyl-L-alanine amidase [Parabacteroides sp.]|nr:N-acetylmuramoyl-L-alanine amidase [Parabacteroides sp.]
MKKEDIDAIVIHCSATREGQDIGKSEITQMHIARNFATIGYNFIVRLDGTVESGRSLTIDGAHCNTKGLSGKSYNKHSIGICYIGGLDKNGKAKDTRTDAQKKALRELIAKLVKEYPIKEIIGHRDASPDLDGNGEIEPKEWIKLCPCFSAKEEYKDLLP